MNPRPWVLAAAVAACADPPASAPPTGDPQAPVALTPLPPDAAAARASLTLRGVRPTPAELAAVRADPDALPGLVDAWLADPRFVETIKELYAEALYLRSPDVILLPVGPHLRTPLGALGAAVSEEPLRLIGEVVRDDLPLSTLVTADWTVLDAVGAEIWQGHDYDPSGPDVQRVRFTDGRPAAGLLTTNGLWVRHSSMGANHHRGRANAVSRALLCVDYLERDVPIDGSVDLSDDDAVARAVDGNPACVSCHQSLDPLASALWPIFPQVDAGAVGLATLSGCVGPLADLCYPLRLWTPELKGAWRLLGLRPPGLAGTDVDDLGQLGAALAADPRLPACAARRVWSFLTETPLAEVPLDVQADLQDALGGPDGTLRSLARAAVLHPRFLAADADDPAVAAALPGPIVARPEQLARMVEALTGFSWTLQPDGPECTLLGLNCYGDVQLAFDDVHGVRAMAGGVDGSAVLVPVHHPTPVQQLVVAALAEEAAGWLLRTELDLPAAERRLLHLVEADTTDEAAVRAQLVALHEAVLSEALPLDDPAIDATWALWSSVDGPPRRAWMVTLAALLQAPQAWTW